MRNLFLVDINPGGQVLLTILAVLLTVGVIVFLFFSTRKERIRYRNTEGKKRIYLTREETINNLTETINVSTTKTKFYLFGILIDDTDGIIKSYGQENFRKTIELIMNSLAVQLPVGTRVYRYSDDKLFVFMRDTGAGFKVEKQVRFIMDIVRRKQLVENDVQVEIDVNIGVVLYPEMGKTYDDIVKSLDIAIVTAKRQGRNKYVVFLQDLSSTSNPQEYDFYNEIKNAMANKEFVLFYQPIVSLEDKEVIGAECLIRWEHEKQGLLTPDKFLPVMERTGDINWVGYWSFEQMVKQLSEWRSKYEQRFWLSMNLSVRQIANGELVSEFKRILKKYKADAKDFGIEIYDISMYNNSEAFKATVDELAAMGFRITIDKYGRDFNGLVQLEQMPIKQIKLDNVFLNRAKSSPLTESVVSAISDYCKRKDITLIADGVETEEDLEFSEEKGMSYAQGYYFSRPKEKSEFIGEVLLTPWKS